MSQGPTIDLSQLANFRPPQIPAGWIRMGVIGLGLLILILSSVFTVAADEAGVIQRFGAYVRLADPGLNFKLPLGIETVTKVPVRRQLKQEFGFRTLDVGLRSRYSELDFAGESLMLTGDLNAAQVEWIVQYRVEDPELFLFRVRNAEDTFRSVTEAVMRQIVGDRTVNEVLTVGRVEVADAVANMLRELCKQYELGLTVEQVVLQDVTPPGPVRPAFNEVNEAQQEREKLINQARSAYNQVIPAARGAAQQTVEEAEGYALERVNRARGEAARFNAVLAEYLKAKEVTRRRIYLETMNEVMQNVGRKLITDEKASGILPLFSIDPDRVAPGREGGDRR